MQFKIILRLSLKDDFQQRRYSEESSSLGQSGSEFCINIHKWEAGTRFLSIFRADFSQLYICQLVFFTNLGLLDKLFFSLCCALKKIYITKQFVEKRQFTYMWKHHRFNIFIYVNPLKFSVVFIMQEIYLVPISLYQQMQLSGIGDLALFKKICITIWTGDSFFG